ncbi:MAG TPA: nucleotidyltransferase family protein [Candidatus Polarisedimenticolia bacterium]|nr:nucleotidyltransferase family protein [Candidatus Polarisedimenticolia bacterium]
MPARRPEVSLQAQVLKALQGVAPSSDVAAAEAERALRHYECGGYLHALWRQLGRPLPEPWGRAAAGLHRRTLVDSLSALGQLREVSQILEAERIDFLVLKGASYLADLYPDVGARQLVDVDLLVRPEGTAAVARKLVDLGFQGTVGEHYPEDERFEMVRPGHASDCGIEFHWRLGVEGRMRLDQEALWSAAEPFAIDGVPYRRLGIHEAIVYHAGHAADHYFGPGLKWTIDLREMLRTWRPSPERLLALAEAWGLRVALHLALVQVDRIFPGEVPAGLLRGTAPGLVRRLGLSLVRSGEPAELLRGGGGGQPRWFLRPLLIDAVGDVIAVSARVLRRPLVRAWRRHVSGQAPAPWEAAA